MFKVKAVLDFVVVTEAVVIVVEVEVEVVLVVVKAVGVIVVLILGGAGAPKEPVTSRKTLQFYVN